MLFPFGWTLDITAFSVQKLRYLDLELEQMLAKVKKRFTLYIHFLLHDPKSQHSFWNETT